MLLLPELLPEVEREEIADMLSLFLDLPLDVTARAVSPHPERLHIETAPVRAEPERIAGSVRLCARVHTAGDRHLEMPFEVLALRNAVIECLGRQHSGTRLQRVASWTAEIADSPSTAIRFAGAAIAHHHERPEADDIELYCAGLATSAAWLLRGLDARVAQWILALSVTPREPDRLVSTEAAILGRAAALQRAFEAGLIHTLPDESGEPLDLRRPLDALGRLRDAPIDWPSDRAPIALLSAALRPHLVPEVRLVLDRLLRPAPPPLGLTGPRRARAFMGRDDVVKRLVTLFEPANEIRTCVLYGVDGIGKSQVAAAVGERLGSRLEPIWVRFTEGPEHGWTRIATALGIDAGPPVDQRDSSGVPRWARDVHAALCARPCLLVVEGADSISEDDLPAWLPVGSGSSAVLILSERSQRPLQRRHDAIAVRLGALEPEESRRLLAFEAPRLGQAIEKGEADQLLEKLGGYPLAIVLTAALLEKEGLDEVTRLVSHGADVIRGVLGPLIDSLSENERAMLSALAVCAPGGSSPTLPIAILGRADGDALIDRLAERALVARESRTVRLDGPARIEMERRLDERPEERTRLEQDHAKRVLDVFNASETAGPHAPADECIDDALLAIDRMSALCKVGHRAAADLLVPLAESLREYSRGNQTVNIDRAIEEYRAALAVFTKKDLPWEWARTQNNLGNALTQLPKGDPNDNLRQAVEAYRAALTVYTKDELPREWAMTQNNLGNALRVLPTGNRSDNLRQAVEAYRAALTVRTKDELPREWAATQNNLGIVLGKLPTGDRSDNLKQAVEACRAALTVLRKEEVPRDWAATQNNLGRALANLPTGDRSDNLRQAMEAYRAALEVLTAEQFPKDHAFVQQNLDDAVRQLADLSSPPTDPT